MGVEHLEEIAAALIASGRPAEGPAALVEWGTHPRQRTIVGTVADLAARARAARAGAPAVIVFGDVVALRKEATAEPIAALEAVRRKPVSTTPHP